MDWISITQDVISSTISGILVVVFGGVTEEIRYKGPANKVRAVLNAPIFEEKNDDAL